MGTKAKAGRPVKRLLQEPVRDNGGSGQGVLVEERGHFQNFLMDWI